ncbi:transposase is4 [Holotrichia oblita]|uniref:Transposase is4 n=1 Tax=Holotrichia oblita TaxID=644536 RepID=A0ACB9SUS0_HOLOL|nr:transposase is4 [Holotrichia oblita]
MKQFITYGFKFWCLTTSEGYTLKFEPYSGAGDKQTGKPLGSSVTEKFFLNYLPGDSFVFLDNFFNSLPLLETLKKNNIKCIGTIRADRVERAPLNDLKKESRGSYHAIQDKDSSITLIRWNNNQVTIATNYLDENICGTKGQCKWWSKKEESFIHVPQPILIDLYNQGMGGVDLFDKMRGLYRIHNIIFVGEIKKLAPKENGMDNMLTDGMEQKGNELRNKNQKEKSEYMLMATWNVRRTYYEGTLKNLEEEARKYRIASDGTAVNQIDHVMVEEKFKNVIKDVRVYRGWR